MACGESEHARMTFRRQLQLFSLRKVCLNQLFLCERLIRVGKDFFELVERQVRRFFFFRLGDCIDVILHPDQGFFIVSSLKEGSEVGECRGSVGFSQFCSVLEKTQLQTHSCHQVTVIPK